MIQNALFGLYKNSQMYVLVCFHILFAFDKFFSF